VSRGPGAAQRFVLDASLLEGCGRFEWERIVLRVVMPSSAKLVALALATYANKDGTRAHPGSARLVAVTGLGRRSVLRWLDLLREIGLIERTFAGSSAGRKALADEYRLTCPVDLLEVVEVLPMDEQVPPRAPVPLEQVPPRIPVPGVTDSSNGVTKPGPRGDISDGTGAISDTEQVPSATGTGAISDGTGVRGGTPPNQLHQTTHHQGGKSTNALAGARAPATCPHGNDPGFIDSARRNPKCGDCRRALNRR
jgi:hypothetical protein